MLADSLEELHTFAHQLGLDRRWFHKNASYPHYDITVEMRNNALRNGALLSNRETIIFCAKRLKMELATTTSQSKRSTIGASVSATNRQIDFFESTDLVA